MPLHPTRYAQMLSDRVRDAKVNVWLVNTGWTGGPYGTGKRMNLPYTRALISAALNDQLTSVPFKQHEVFGLKMPLSCPEVPSEILDPRNTWKDKDAYDNQANALASAFLRNFEKFSSHSGDEIIAGAPKVSQYH